MKKFISTLIFVIASVQISLAQHQADWWYLGDSCGINFNNNILTNINNANLGFTSTASISDTNGNLIFYSNGALIYNRLHQKMPNGDTLFGEIYPISGPGTFYFQFGGKCFNSLNILPTPGAENKYTIVYINRFTYPLHIGIWGLNYAQVDMDADGGNGDLISKNVVAYHDLLSAGLLPIQHANGRDWWLLAHNCYNPIAAQESVEYPSTASNKFLVFLHDPTGIHLVDTILTGPHVGDVGAGEFCYDKNYNRVVFCQPQLNPTTPHLFIGKFDRCIGQLQALSDQAGILNYQAGELPFGAEFSKTGNYLFVSSHERIWQVRIFPNDSFGTPYLVFTTVNDGEHRVSPLQRGPDGKIYFATYPTLTNILNHIYDSLNTHLHRIEFPDSAGAACGLQINYLDVDSSVFIGLPNFADFTIGKIVGSACDTIQEPEDTTSVMQLKNNFVITAFPNPASNDVTFQCSRPLPYNAEIKISDAVGRVVYENKWKRNEQYLTINTKPFSAGVYFWEVKQKGIVVQGGKVVVQH